MKIRSLEDLGLRVRDRRLELDWSQGELAEKVGVSRQWVASLERGKPGSALGQVLQVLSVLGLDLEVRPRRPRTGARPRLSAGPTLTDADVHLLLDDVLDRHRVPGADARTPLRPSNKGSRRRPEED
jgi:HTH-type transcriptional regulator/antitoxin HipB